MDFQKAIETIKQYLPDYANEHLTHSKGKNQFDCVFCGSGTGVNGTGAFTVYPTSYYCFACQNHGDIFNLAEKVENIPQKEVIYYLADKYHVGIDNNSSYHLQEIQKPISADLEDDYTDFFIRANQHLSETDYYRGISLKTLNFFKIGYVQQWKHPKSNKSPATPRLIIPTSRTSYLARDTRSTADIPADQRKYTKVKVGKVHIFNIKALKNNSVIYITEGEIDALSIIDVGCPAIALGGASHVKTFLKIADENADTLSNCKFIISLDSDKAGEQAKNELVKGLKERKIKYCCYNTCNGYKDQNEALMNDRNSFQRVIEWGAANVDSLIAEQSARERAELDKKKAEYIKKYSATSSLQSFLNGIAENANTDSVPTGFKTLDSVLDGGLYEGLYSIGAISSLGKTTFALQIADQIAEQGHQVLVFSLEMSKNELIAKSISRNTIKRIAASKGNPQYAKTTRGILTGKKYAFYNQTEKEIIQNSVLDYAKISDNIFIHEGMGDVTADDIVRQVKEHIESGQNPPVVIVDYLQILSPRNPRATDKQNTDSAILTFKRLSRDYKIPVIVISSFNRENYAAKVSMQAFKESGAIEYSTDVLIALQLRGTGTKDFDVDQAKSKNPREIEAVILKNRNGMTGKKVNFKFYAMFNYFAEETQQDI